MQLNGDDALVPPPNSAYEFDATAADAPDPAPSEDTPGTDQESPVTPGGEQVPDEDTSDAKPPEFDPRYREPFVGLLHVGYLAATFEFLGHTFRIATPTRRERIQMGLAIRPYQGTATWELAYQSAMVAAYLIEVDGQKLPEPVLTSAKEDAFTERFKWVNENVMDHVMDEIYTKCLELDGTVKDVIAAMGKASR
jgi:hypothetical protein